MHTTIIYIEATTSQIKDTIACSDVAKAHMEPATAHIEPTTIHAEVVTAHVEDSITHAEAAISNIAAATSHVHPFESTTTAHEKIVKPFLMFSVFP